VRIGQYMLRSSRLYDKDDDGGGGGGGNETPPLTLADVGKLVDEKLSAAVSPITAKLKGLDGLTESVGSIVKALKKDPDDDTDDNTDDGDQKKLFPDGRKKEGGDDEGTRALRESMRKEKKRNDRLEQELKELNSARKSDAAKAEKSDRENQVRQAIAEAVGENKVTLVEKGDTLAYKALFQDVRRADPDNPDSELVVGDEDRALKGYVSDWLTGDGAVLVKAPSSGGSDSGRNSGGGGKVKFHPNMTKEEAAKGLAQLAQETS